MIQISDKRDCCGCTACASVCAHNAIRMKADVMGFMYPVVDPDLCVDCGLCDKVCQFNENYNRYQNFDEPIVFGGRHKDIEELEHSQSGGASWAIIQKFIKNDGIVYGVGFDTPIHIVHKRAADIEECEDFRGSKYVQSDLRDIFPSIKKDLLSGNKVLFFGTGCQVAGLKSYLPQKLHENLLTVDLVCHATPSPAVWESYVKYYEKKYKSKVVKAWFRNKLYGWHSHKESFQLNDGKCLSMEYFRTLFYDHLIIRDSCTNCPYTNFKRVSDITIGDFWGWEKCYEEWNDNKGVSLILVNSEKGKEYLSELDNLCIIKSDTLKCKQPQLCHPIEPNIESAQIPELLKKSGFKGIARKYGFIPGRTYYRNLIRAYVHKLHLVLSKIKHKIV